MAESRKQRDKTSERATYLTLIGLFWGIFLAFLPRRGETRPLDLGPLDLGMLGLATYRMGRLASDDLVTQPLREPFTDVQPDETGAGENTVAEGTGPRKALGELISCPTCVGTWAAAFLVYGLRIAPGPTRFFLAIMATTGLAEVIDSLVEDLRWSSRMARKAAA
ncbi:MAG: hypothetical protein QOF73_2044 [Thermomicrobiales bacterium]|nr:hypothetical protein [Thermomicrobiales bacterium]